MAAPRSVSSILAQTIDQHAHAAMHGVVSPPMARAMLWEWTGTNPTMTQRKEENAMQPMSLAPKVCRTRLYDRQVCHLMTPNPVSGRHGITFREAARFLAERGIGAAPVVNDAGRAVGVLSRTDVLKAVNAGLDGAPIREVMSPG